MNRREVLTYISYATGAAVSIPLVTTLLSGCKTDTAGTVANYKPVFFNKKQFTNLEKLVDIILPKTDTPAASEVGVHRMIDAMTECYEADEKTKYKTNFEALVSYLKDKAGDKEFVDIPQEERITILKTLDSPENDNLAKTGYLELKQQTIAYYLNTEEIATTYLNYLPVPGDYEGCIDLSEVNGKAWAL
jgi:hypothetical protein